MTITVCVTLEWAAARLRRIKQVLVATTSCSWHVDQELGSGGCSLEGVQLGNVERIEFVRRSTHFNKPEYFKRGYGRGQSHSVTSQVRTIRSINFYYSPLESDRVTNGHLPGRSGLTMTDWLNLISIESVVQWVQGAQPRGHRDWWRCWVQFLTLVFKTNWLLGFLAGIS